MICHCIINVGEAWLCYRALYCSYYVVLLVVVYYEPIWCTIVIGNVWFVTNVFFAVTVLLGLKMIALFKWMSPSRWWTKACCVIVGHISEISGTSSTLWSLWQLLWHFLSRKYSTSLLTAEPLMLNIFCASEWVLFSP